jgi:hypothetical protein
MLAFKARLKKVGEPTSRFLWRLKSLGIRSKYKKYLGQRGCKKYLGQRSVLLPQRATVQTISPSELAIAAIFKNEADYMKQWIEFHLMVGVDRFFLYDNGSSDNFLPVLSEYLVSGQVCLTSWRNFAGASAQTLAYAHAACNCGERVRWLALIDLDEFLFSEKRSDLKTIFAELDKFDAVRIPRFEYGTNGHKTKPPGLLIENYTKCSRWLLPGKRAKKTVANPIRMRIIDGPHKVQVMGKEWRLEQAEGPLPLRLNHYFSKSQDEFHRKCRRGYDWKSGSSAEARTMLRYIEDNAVEYRMDTLCHLLRQRLKLDRAREPVVRLVSRTGRRM